MSARFSPPSRSTARSTACSGPTRSARWAEATPDDFVFAVKGPRFLTHMKRLNEPVAPLANFIASGLLRLGPKLGPILWQLAAQLPLRSRQARRLLLAAAARHRGGGGLRSPPRSSAQGAGPGCGQTRDDRLRHALEVRHESFRDPAFIELLRKHDIALVCADTVEWPLLMDLTSDFVYCRLHGSRELYRSGYSAAEIERWADRIRAWRDGKPMQRRYVRRAPRPRPCRATSSSISTTPTSSRRRTTRRR